MSAGTGVDVDGVGAVRETAPRHFFMAWDDKPYDLFFLDVDGLRLFGRKTPAAYPDPASGTELKCTLVEARMVLGVAEREQVFQDGVVVHYRPLPDAERTALFAKATQDPMCDLYHPYARLDGAERTEILSDPEFWTDSSERVDELDHAESVLRDYTVKRLREHGFDGGTVYDPACSTGAFLSAVKQAFPQARTVGQDLSADMVRHAGTRVDEVHHGDSIAPALSPGSADLVVCRHLNACVVPTRQAHELFLAAAGTCRTGGLVVLLGHTPVLPSAQWCASLGMTVEQRTGRTPSGHALFQFYVLRRTGPLPGPGEGAWAR
ncbi:class I SAM-dependent methyltransferase [Streptomyces daliensis]